MATTPLMHRSRHLSRSRPNTSNHPSSSTLRQHHHHLLARSISLLLTSTADIHLVFTTLFFPKRLLLHTNTTAEHGYFQQYEQPRHYHEDDRDSKRARLSPFSEYESSSSDGECARSIASLSDYSRSPQLSAHSQANSTRTSPIIGGYSPVLGATPIIRPRSNSYNTHLVAGFPGPVKKIRKNRRKLAPLEREQVHQLRKMGACTRCWGLKMKVGFSAALVKTGSC